MRVSHLNLEWYQKFYNELRQTVASRGPNSQSSWWFHAHDLAVLGQLAIALEHPLAETRACFRQAVDAYREVFLRRGQSISKRVLYQDGQPLPEETIVDDGYTSVDSFDAAILALTVCNVATALELVKLAGHSPSAELVTAQSEVCTSNQQTLSHALNALLAGDLNQAQVEARKLEARKGNRHDRRLGAILGAIAKDSDVLSELEGLLYDFAKEARLGEKQLHSGCFLCLPALGLTRLAISLGRIELTDLDPDNPYVPTALLQDDFPMTDPA